MRDEVRAPRQQERRERPGITEGEDPSARVDVFASAEGQHRTGAGVEQGLEREQPTRPKKVVVTDPGVVGLAVAGRQPEVDRGGDPGLRVVDDLRAESLRERPCGGRSGRCDDDERECDIRPLRLYGFQRFLERFKAIAEGGKDD